MHIYDNIYNYILNLTEVQKYLPAALYIYCRKISKR